MALFHSQRLCYVINIYIDIYIFIYLFQSMGKSLTFEQSVMDTIDFAKKYKCKNPICETQLWKVRHELDLALVKIEALQKQLA